MNFSPKLFERESASGHRAAREWTIVETVNAIMTLLLIVSPWMLRYLDTAVATWSAVLIGLLLGVATFTRLLKVRAWQSWASLALGACALLAPWLLGFGDISNAAGIHIAVGFIGVVMTLISLWVHYLDEHGSAGAV